MKRRQIWMKYRQRYGNIVEKSWKSECGAIVIEYGKERIGWRIEKRD